RGLAHQDEARVTDALDERVEVRGRVRQGLGRHADAVEQEGGGALLLGVERAHTGKVSPRKEHAQPAWWSRRTGGRGGAPSAPWPSSGECTFMESGVGYPPVLRPTRGAPHWRPAIAVPTLSSHQRDVGRLVGGRAMVGTRWLLVGALLTASVAQG